MNNFFVVELPATPRISDELNFMGENFCGLALTREIRENVNLENFRLYGNLGAF